MTNVKGRVKEELQKATAWLSVVDMVDLVGGTPTICHATVARALRKLWEESVAAKMKLPGDNHGRMQWIAMANAKLGFPDAKPVTVSAPKVKKPRTKKTKNGSPITPINTANNQGALIMQIEQGVESIVAELVAADKKFSAHDVTKTLRDRVNTGTIQVDPGLAGTAHVGGKDVTKIEHGYVRDAVHALMTGGKYPAYDRETNGTFWEYFPQAAAAPATPATTPDPNAPPAAPYDGNSTL